MLKIILVNLFLISSAYCYVDLKLEYTYSTRRVEAVDADGELDADLGEAKSTTKGFSVNWAWYVWEYTAIEFNYAESEERIEDDRSATDGSITINNQDSLVKTTTQGVGIRQSFANRKARIIPSISIGYARYTTSGQTTYKLTDGGVAREIVLNRDKEVTNSSYASATLAFKITKLLRLTFSAKTIVPGFEIDKADKNVSYFGGLSWVF